MGYLTLEAEIDHGRITVAEPEKLPVTGKALVTVLEATPAKRPDWAVIARILGSGKGRLDGLAIERDARAEWEEREKNQWTNWEQR